MKFHKLLLLSFITLNICAREIKLTCAGRETPISEAAAKESETLKNIIEGTSDEDLSIPIADDDFYYLIPLVVEFLETIANSNDLDKSIAEINKILAKELNVYDLSLLANFLDFLDVPILLNNVLDLLSKKISNPSKLVEMLDTLNDELAKQVVYNFIDNSEYSPARILSVEDEEFYRFVMSGDGSTIIATYPRPKSGGHDKQFIFKYGNLVPNRNEKFEIIGVNHDSSIMIGFNKDEKYVEYDAKEDYINTWHRGNIYIFKDNLIKAIPGKYINAIISDDGSTIAAIGQKHNNLYIFKNGDLYKNIPGKYSQISINSDGSTIVATRYTDSFVSNNLYIFKNGILLSSIPGKWKYPNISSDGYTTAVINWLNEGGGPVYILKDENIKIIDGNYNFISISEDGSTLIALEKINDNITIQTGDYKGGIVSPHDLKIFKNGELIQNIKYKKSTEYIFQEISSNGLIIAVRVIPQNYIQIFSKLTKLRKLLSQLKEPQKTQAEQRLTDLGFNVKLVNI